MAHILIVEDNPVERELVAAMLEALGHRSTTAIDGFEAIRVMIESAADFDLILLDLQMPLIDGISTLGHFKTHYPKVPVVILTGTADKSDIQLIENWKADGFIKKPPTPEKLKEVIERIVPTASNARHGT